MESIRQMASHDPLKLVIAACLLLVSLAAGYVVKRLLFRALRRWGDKTSSKVDVVLTKSLRGPIAIWSLILGIYFATESLDLPDRFTRLIEHTLLILTILSLTLMASRLAGNLIRHYGTRVPGAMPVTTLTQNLAQLFIVLVGILILLYHFGVSITPILTAFGVGGLAVALALQDTLSNLFAGFYVSVAGQVRLGDYIKLNTGEEGYVRDITWRSTTIRALGNNLIIIPNAKLAQAIVTNYSLPERRMSLDIRVNASYDSDPDHVERVLLEEARNAAGAIPGLLAEPEPSVRLIPGFGDSALNFTLGCQVAEFVDQFLVQHELRKRILKRFQAERIDMPFPVRTVYLREQPGSQHESPQGHP
jgi:small-conductance mechanosensitive channel